MSEGPVEILLTEVQELEAQLERAKHERVNATAKLANRDEIIGRWLTSRRDDREPGSCCWVAADELLKEFQSYVRTT